MTCAQNIKDKLPFNARMESWRAEIKGENSARVESFVILRGSINFAARQSQLLSIFLILESFILNLSKIFACGHATKTFAFLLV